MIICYLGGGRTCIRVWEVGRGWFWVCLCLTKASLATTRRSDHRDWDGDRNKPFAGRRGRPQTSVSQNSYSTSTANPNATSATGGVRSSLLGALLQRRSRCRMEGRCWILLLVDDRHRDREDGLDTDQDWDRRLRVQSVIITVRCRLVDLAYSALTLASSAD